MKKILQLLLLSIFVFSCGGDDDVEPEKDFLLSEWRLASQQVKMVLFNQSQNDKFDYKNDGIVFTVGEKNVLETNIGARYGAGKSFERTSKYITEYTRGGNRISFDLMDPSLGSLVKINFTIKKLTADELVLVQDKRDTISFMRQYKEMVEAQGLDYDFLENLINMASSVESEISFVR